MVSFCRERLEREAADHRRGWDVAARRCDRLDSEIVRLEVGALAVCRRVVFCEAELRRARSGTWRQWGHFEARWSTWSEWGDLEPLRGLESRVAVVPVDALEEPAFEVVEALSCVLMLGCGAGGGPRSRLSRSLGD